MYDWSHNYNEMNTSEELDGSECHPELMSKNKLIKRLKEVFIDMYFIY